MITSRNDRFSIGGDKYRSLLIAAAMLCGAFAATAANLPAGYTKVEYIQGDGSTGYLVTDFSPDPSNDTIVFQGRTDDNQDSSLFLDDVSLWVTKKISRFSIIVR